MLEKKFDAKFVQNEAAAIWQDEYFFTSGKGDPYCIMLPPPNVTGTLHLGHGFQISLMDALIRFYRMSGKDSLWQPGTDHGGIATQLVVERQLAKKNIDPKSLGREVFEEKVWEWKLKSGNAILDQMKKMGASCDWSRTCFTMDSKLSSAVTTAFVRLYEDGLIYRGKRLVNWDPILKTALSDLEVFFEETQGSMWHLRYPVVGQEATSCLEVATTRPETLFGDVAVAVNPGDERYKHLIGKMLHLPLTNRQIPIIADEYVDPSFGTGCVKITPAHDFNDFEVGKRHNLDVLNILTDDGLLNQEVPEAYRGLNRENARKKIIEDLNAQNLIAKVESHTLQIPYSEKSKAIIEPYLSEQWYLKMADMAKDALQVVEQGKIEFIPKQWENTYRQWLENIEDWCLSRQLWWGHRIPAWYDEKGNIYIAETLEEAQKKAGMGVVLKQDEDVLDTWFSSALWPFSTLGWPNDTPDLKRYYPTNVLVTGFDIIFFWVARMIMFGLYFMKEVPFKQVLFTGLIRDQEGQKMSKSKGNIIDPLDVIQGISLDDLMLKQTQNLVLTSQKKIIEQTTKKQFPNGIPACGVDALRFTYCALATQGRDVRFDLGRAEGYRNFCNKLWNAARFIEMQLNKFNVSNLSVGFPEVSSCNLPEQWIIDKLNETTRTCYQHFKDYRFDLLAQCLYEFSWYEFCDWYLEFVKVRLNQKIDLTILQVLVNSFDSLLRLLHPLMPFITEVLWQNLVKPVLQFSEKSLTLISYPEPKVLNLKEAIESIELSKETIEAIRGIRSQYQITQKKIPEVFIKPATNSEKIFHLLAQKEVLFLIEELAKVEKITFLQENEVPPGSSVSSITEKHVLTISLLNKDAIDEDSIKEKSKKEIEKLLTEKVKLEEHLSQGRAPQEILEKWRKRFLEIDQAIANHKKLIGEANHE